MVVIHYTKKKKVQVFSKFHKHQLKSYLVQTEHFHRVLKIRKKIPGTLGKFGKKVLRSGVLNQEQFSRIRRSLPYRLFLIFNLRLEHKRSTEVRTSSDMRKKVLVKQGRRYPTGSPEVIATPQVSTEIRDYLW